MKFLVRSALRGFSLVEVVIAIGIVSFALLSTFGLLSVANDTNRRARDEQAAAQLTQNEFQRIRSLSAANFPTSTYLPRYYDSSLTDLQAAGTPLPGAVYELKMTIAPYPSPAPSPYPAATEFIFNAEVHYPVTAAAANQNVVRFTTLMNLPP